MRQQIGSNFQKVKKKTELVVIDWRLGAKVPPRDPADRINRYSVVLSEGYSPSLLTVSLLAWWRKRCRGVAEERAELCGGVTGTGIGEEVRAEQ
ncbi:MAG: hypothetical protein QOE70_3271 [Chthoniobacter sp.]|jgi:hypothetical protein|nr:hypothetical protein [Chthoniobacter sp.]